MFSNFFSVCWLLLIFHVFIYLIFPLSSLNISTFLYSSLSFPTFFPWSLLILPCIHSTLIYPNLRYSYKPGSLQGSNLRYSWEPGFYQGSSVIFDIVGNLVLIREVRSARQVSWTSLITTRFLKVLRYNSFWWTDN